MNMEMEALWTRYAMLVVATRAFPEMRKNGTRVAGVLQPSPVTLGNLGIAVAE